MQTPAHPENALATTLTTTDVQQAETALGIFQRRHLLKLMSAVAGTGGLAACGGGGDLGDIDPSRETPAGADAEMMPPWDVKGGELEQKRSASTKHSESTYESGIVYFFNTVFPPVVKKHRDFLHNYLRTLLNEPKADLSTDAKYTAAIDRWVNKKQVTNPLTHWLAGTALLISINRPDKIVDYNQYTAWVNWFYACTDDQFYNLNHVNVHIRECIYTWFSLPADETVFNSFKSALEAGAARYHPVRHLVGTTRDTESREEANGVIKIAHWPGNTTMPAPMTLPSLKKLKLTNSLVRQRAQSSMNSTYLGDQLIVDNNTVIWGYEGITKPETVTWPVVLTGAPPKQFKRYLRTKEMVSHIIDNNVFDRGAHNTSVEYQFYGLDVSCSEILNQSIFTEQKELDIYKKIMTQCLDASGSGAVAAATASGATRAVGHIMVTIIRGLYWKNSLNNIELKWAGTMVDPNGITHDLFQVANRDPLIVAKGAAYTAGMSSFAFIACIIIFTEQEVKKNPNVDAGTVRKKFFDTYGWSSVSAALSGAIALGIGEAYRKFPTLAEQTVFDDYVKGIMSSLPTGFAVIDAIGGVNDLISFINSAHAYAKKKTAATLTTLGGAGLSLLGRIVACSAHSATYAKWHPNTVGHISTKTYAAAMGAMGAVAFIIGAQLNKLK